jgi:hypothetical protein
MMMNARMLVLLLLVGFFGCGSPIQEERVTPPSVTPQEAIRAALNQVVETGQAGSAIGGMMQHIEALKASDPATAAVLEEGANQLMSMDAGNPEAAKAKARELLTRLDSGGGGGQSGGSPPE